MKKRNAVSNALTIVAALVTLVFGTIAREFQDMSDKEKYFLLGMVAMLVLEFAMLETF